VSTADHAGADDASKTEETARRLEYHPDTHAAGSDENLAGQVIAVGAVRFIQTLLGHANLETTTIYTKVSVLKQASISSPLDQLQGATAPQPSPAPAPAAVNPVGRLRIDMQPIETDGEQRIAKTSITILNEPAVTLSGIVIREARPGWVAMELPPEEAWSESWSESLAWLSGPQRERVKSADFCELLQQRLRQTFLERCC